tara:strand:- start:102 stop:374 length:273 start_codon:yes stop_codon:yes gene_type:complete
MDKIYFNSIKDIVRNKIIELSEQSGNNSSSLTDNENIPERGYLDSAGIIDLIIWIESYFNIIINDEEITIKNLGSVNTIANFVCEIKKDQ